MTKDKKKILLVALGGNALIRKGQQGTVKEQFENLKLPVSQIAKLSKKYKIIITHGNGPQVGDLLLQQECCDAAPRLPLEILVAQTQGQIGYMIESTLDSELMSMGIQTHQRIVSLLSYVVVDENDPAFKEPTKPIGPVFTEQEVFTEQKTEKLPYPVKKTAKGFRRVVVSPRPVTIVVKREIKTLINMDFIVICCGGGGIPVIRDGRRFNGVDAVIDKDLASATLAKEVGVDIFVIASDVSGAALNYGTDKQEFLRHLTVFDAKKHFNQGHFPQGSMGPKIEACIEVMEKKRKRAVICSIEDIEKAVSGNAGTEIIND
ncbi:carbamate kinase [Desulfobacterales bacterium HSG17]|nr:carbamate kinase [Desulfobacterales bacterium HSG17]